MLHQKNADQESSDWEGCISLLLGPNIIILPPVVISNLLPCDIHCFVKVIAITFYSSSNLGQETAKRPFGLQVKWPIAHLFNPTWNRTRIYRFSSRRSTIYCFSSRSTVSPAFDH